MGLDIIARAAALAAKSDAAAALTNASPVSRFADLPSLNVSAGVVSFSTNGHSTPGTGAARYIADSTANSALAAAHPRACKGDASGRYFRLLPDERGAIAVDALGAAGNGTADDLTAIDAARNYASAIGARRISFHRSRTYRTSAHIACGNNLSWDFNGATLKCSQQVEVFGSKTAGATLLAYVTADVAGPTSTLTVSSTAAFSVGQFVLVRLGHNPWDNLEPRWGQSCKIVSINSGASTITIDATVPRTIPLNYASTYRLSNGTTVAVPAVTGTGINRAIYALTDGDNVEVNDLVFVGDTPSNNSVEGVLWFQGGRNLRFNNIRANLDTAGTGDAGCGLIGLLQFCRNVVVNDPIMLDNKNGRAQPSLGRMFNMSNCINVQVRNPVCRNSQSSLIFAESFCEEVVIDSPLLEVPGLWSAGTAAFYVVQGSEVTLRDPLIMAPQGKNWQMFDNGGADGRLDLVGHVKIRGEFPNGLPVGGAMLLDYDGPACAPTTVTLAGTTMTLASAKTGLHAGVEVLGNGIAAGTRITGEIGGGVYTVSVSQTVAAGTAANFREWAMVDYRASRCVNVKVPMSDPGTYGLEGPFWGLRIMATSGVDLANIAGIYPARGGAVVADLKSQVAAGCGVWASLMNLMAGQTTGCVQNLTGKGTIGFFRSGGTPLPEAFLGISALVPRVIKSSFTDAAMPFEATTPVSYFDEWMEQATIGQKVLRGSATYAPPSVAAGAQTSTSVAVIGAQVGDFVEVSFTNALSGLRMSGEVTASNAVTVTLDNNTAAAVNLASGTLRARVIH